MAACKDCGKALDFDKMLCRFCGGWTAVDKEVGTLGSVSEKSTVMLDQVDASSVERIVTGCTWDAAFGGGIVPTGIVLMGGQPGSGKTTILLQISSLLAGLTGKTAYYFSAEQAPGELKMTVDRLQLEHVSRIRVIREMGGGAEIEAALLKKDPPCLFVIDSITALCGQDKIAALEVTKRFKTLSAKWGAASILIGQMSKENDFMGLNAVQHQVDTLITIGCPDNDRDVVKVLSDTYPKLERKHLRKLMNDGRLDEITRDMRITTTWKNRFGPSHVETALMMTPRGLLPLPSMEEILGTGAHSFSRVTRAASPEGRPPRPTTVIPPPSSEANVIGDSLHPAGPDEIVVNGQKLKRVKSKKKKKGWFTEGADAPAGGMPPIAGEALKKPRPAIARTAEGKRAALQRRKTEKAAARKKEARA